MARTTINELKRRRLADASAGERTEFDETYATTALTIRVGEPIRDARSSPSPSSFAAREEDADSACE